MGLVLESIGEGCQDIDSGVFPGTGRHEKLGLPKRKDRFRFDREQNVQGRRQAIYASHLEAQKIMLTCIDCPNLLIMFRLDSSWDTPTNTASSCILYRSE